MASLLTSVGRGGAVVRHGELLAVYSGNNGKGRAEAFFSALTEGYTKKTRELADLSGIPHREISRALRLNWEFRGDV